MKDRNLIPNTARSPEKLREMGRKGGIASGESRRRARNIKKMAKWILGDSLEALAEEYGALFRGGYPDDK